MNKMAARLGQEAEGAQPLLPLPFREQIALVKASPAIEAFARKRVGHMSIGHTPESDLTKPPAHFARQARGSLSALIDAIGPYRMNLPPAARTDCMKRIEGAAAMLIALWERVQVEVPEE